MYVFTAYALRAFFTQLGTFQTSSKDPNYGKQRFDLNKQK
ncbi:hypothetical protein GXM_09577 [Nostoc sphaeroides CCNUC1]|uniref:Uncharacterized protein n=1 Tax=Nostoc sphaeroides CCNUC1 TaxID=2653204 RepID=A0A5P8WGX2_9NOSO|nr:hypothetical protein GXM_09577 [Nostoc sphaeroides CCNUC1]